MADKLAVYAGTFDPWTVGHQDVLAAATLLFDRVIVCIMSNPNKNPMFSPDERTEIITASIQSEPGLAARKVTVGHFPGRLTTEVASDTGALWMVRGFRMETEVSHELEMALVNSGLDSSITTVFIPPRQEHIHVSSSTVRSLIRLGRAANALPMLVDGIEPVLVRMLEQDVRMG